MHSGSGMLQNTLKHHLGLMEAIGSVRAKTFIGTSVSRNSASVYRNTTVSHRFACIRVAKCSKTLPNIILGLMEAIGSVRAKTFVRSSLFWNSELVYRNTPVSHPFACIRVAKCSKTLQNIILGLMEAIGCVRVKTFVRSSVPRNSALVETHQFLIVLHAFA